MIESIQYNEFIGTYSGHHLHFTKFMASRGDDISRYDPIGANFNTVIMIFFCFNNWALANKTQQATN